MSKLTNRKKWKGSTSRSININTRRTDRKEPSNNHHTNTKTQDQRSRRLFLNGKKVDQKKGASNNLKSLHKLTKTHNHNIIFSQGLVENEILCLKASNKCLKRLFTSKRKENINSLSSHNHRLHLNKSKKKGKRKKKKTRHISKKVRKKLQSKISWPSQTYLKSVHHATKQRNLAP